MYEGRRRHHRTRLVEYQSCTEHPYGTPYRIDTKFLAANMLVILSQGAEVLLVCTEGHAVANARTYARRQVKAAKYKRAIDMWIQSYKYRYINHIQETNVSLTIHTQNMRTHERVVGLGGIWDGRVDQHKSHFENRCSTFHICHSLYPDIYTSE